MKSYKDDLEDPEEAPATFQEFVHRHPRHRLADQATASHCRTGSRITANRASRRHVCRSGEVSEGGGTGRQIGAQTEAGLQDKSGQYQERDDQESTASAADVPSSGRSGGKIPARDQHPALVDARLHAGRDRSGAGRQVRVAAHRSSRSGFSSISRHESSPQRWWAKTFDVDDGFLKKIRVAQFKPGKTRVVFEVDDLSDYDAFLLPNPSRLIIDIHGKQTGKSEVARNRTMRRARSLPEIGGRHARRSNCNAHLDTQHRARASTCRSRTIDDESADTKPTVKMVKVGKNAVKKIVKPETMTPAHAKTVARSVEDLRPEGLAVAEYCISSRGAATRQDVSAASDQVAQRARRRAASTAQLDIREAPAHGRWRPLTHSSSGTKIGKIVIDPGHGGHDTGMIGPDGLSERPGGRRWAAARQLLDTRLAPRKWSTRKDDTFIPLETRTAIANQEQADLFVSDSREFEPRSECARRGNLLIKFHFVGGRAEVAARERSFGEIDSRTGRPGEEDCAHRKRLKSPTNSPVTCRQLCTAGWRPRVPAAQPRREESSLHRADRCETCPRFWRRFLSSAIRATKPSCRPRIPAAHRGVALSGHREIRKRAEGGRWPAA